MRCANFLRREESLRNSVTQALQCASDFAMSEIEVVGNILQKHERWLVFADDPGNVWPQVSGVADSCASSRNLK